MQPCGNMPGSLLDTCQSMKYQSIYVGSLVFAGHFFMFVDGCFYQEQYHTLADNILACFVCLQSLVYGQIMM